MPTDTIATRETKLDDLNRKKAEIQAKAEISESEAKIAQANKAVIAAMMPSGQNLEGSADVQNYDKLAELCMIDSMDSVTAKLAERMARCEAFKRATKLLVLPKGQLESLGRLKVYYVAHFEYLALRLSRLAKEARVLSSMKKKDAEFPNKSQNGVQDKSPNIHTSISDGSGSKGPSLPLATVPSIVQLASTVLEVVSMFKSDLKGSVMPVDVAWDVLAASVTSTLMKVNVKKNVLSCSVWSHTGVVNTESSFIMTKVREIQTNVEELMSAARLLTKDAEAVKLAETICKVVDATETFIDTLFERKDGAMSVVEKLAYYDRLKEASDGLILEIDMVKAVSGSSVRKWRFFSASVELLYGMAMSYWLSDASGRIFDCGNIVQKPRRRPFSGISDYLWEE
jgi:hypothetical protein